MIFLGACLALLVLLQIRSGSGYSWDPSYEESSRDPLGSKAFYEWLEHHATVRPERLNVRLSESLPLVDTGATVLILTDRFDPDDGSRRALLRHIRRGGSVILAVEELQDSLQEALEVMQRYTADASAIRDVSDTTRRFPEPEGWIASVTPPRSAFRWAGDTVGSYDDPPDHGPWEPLVVGYYDNILAGRRRLGRGEITYIPNPRLFTNYAMLYDSLWHFSALLVEHFPDRPLVVDGHYKPRKSDAQGLLFTVTQYPALNFAYLTALYAALAFVILGVRRRQRPIPTIEPPLNTSIEFATTVAQMYEVRNTRQAIAARLADQFVRVVRRRTGFRIGIDRVEPRLVAQALGIPEADVRHLLSEIEAIQREEWEDSVENYRAFHQRITPIIDKGTA